MSNEYGLEVLLSEMPMPVLAEETVVVSQTQFDQLKQNPEISHRPQIFEITGHPALNIYGSVNDYNHYPDIGYC